MLGSNVPSGSGWQYTLLGNSLVVACVKLAFGQLVAPPLATCLARIRFGSGHSTDLTSEYATRVHQSQVPRRAVDIRMRLSAEPC